MTTQKIKCRACDHSGEIEIEGLNHSVSDYLLFTYKGYDASTGDMHFCCPACGRELLVNPMEILGSESILGQPHVQIAIAALDRFRTNRILNFICFVLATILNCTV